VRSARADVIERLTVHRRWDRVEPDIQPGLAARAHRDAVLVGATHRTISCPSCRARSATPRSSSPRCIAEDSTASSWSFGMFRRRAAIARSPDLIVITRILSARAFGADLRSPLLRVNTVRGADLSAGQQLRIVAAGTVKVIVGDPPKPLVKLGLHAASR
jgi:hypothetical protein